MRTWRLVWLSSVLVVAAVTVPACGDDEAADDDGVGNGGAGATGGSGGSAGSGGTAGTGGSGAGGAGGGGGVPCTGSGFAATATDWSLPTGYVFGFDSLSDWSGCSGDGVFQWATVDIDGDDALDLVLTGNCNDPATGSTRWLVHRGTGSGFAQTATDWSLPTGYVFGFESLSDWSGCSGDGVFQWATIDIDGDGPLDLVLTGNCDDPATGSTRWLVHRGTGSGFAATATDWSLPTGYVFGFGSLSDWSGCSGDGLFQWATIDLDGDGPLDLVLTGNCDDPPTGASRWLLHSGTGSGFAATATDWSLPTGYVFGFGSLSDWSGCSGDGLFQWATIDLDGDGPLDLVLTGNCDDPPTGASRWLLHSGTGSGFAATATDWSLPTGYVFGFGSLSDWSGCSGDGVFQWATLDLDGDGPPDLVLTGNCDDPPTGASRWLLHSGTGSGFAPTASDWSLPTGYVFGFDSLADWNGCSGDGVFQWATTALDGDHLVDLVLTGNCDDPPTGSTRWLLHSGQCSP